VYTQVHITYLITCWFIEEGASKFPVPESFYLTKFRNSVKLKNSLDIAMPIATNFLLMLVYSACALQYKIQVSGVQNKICAAKYSSCAIQIKIHLKSAVEASH